jgi:hypothetical protein
MLIKNMLTTDLIENLFLIVYSLAPCKVARKPFLRCCTRFLRDDRASLTLFQLE